MLSGEPGNRFAPDRVNATHGGRPTWRLRIIRSAFLIAALLSAAFSIGAQVTVPTSRYNNQRTSVNAKETILTPANVNSTNFGKLFSQSFQGYVFAQPLYVPNVTIGGVAHNVVYVATEHDSVYAFDADSNTGANASPLWQTTFLSSGVTTVPSTANTCGDILPEYGITGTPVIDTSTNTLYAVAETMESGSFVSRIHALDITTGLEKPGSPFPISASVTVPGQSAVNFQSKVQGQRAGLLLYNGVVYVGYASHCDNNGWLGWILGYSYNQTNFSQVFVFSTEPSSTTGVGAGIWMGGQGLAMDMGSNLFAATGNGQFDTTHTPPINYGDSIIRIDLSIGPTVQDYFTPFTQSTLDLNDSDLGSGGMAMLFNQAGPNPSLLVQAGKDAVIHVVNQTNMGHFNSSSDNIVQEVSGIGSLYSSPVYFNGKVYFWADNDIVKAYTVTNGTLSTSPTDSGVNTFNFPGATPTISANGISNAILWALNGDGWVDGSGPESPAVLYAYNAANLSAGSIYNSNENLTRDNPGGAIKFAVPTVANGKVYVGEAGELSVFGELVSSPPTISSANSTTFSVGTDGNFTVTTTGTPMPTLTMTGTLPSGVTFVANSNGTATLSGTPAAGTSGTYPLTFTASNGIGTAASQTFTLTVNTAQIAPTITSASSATFTVGGAGTFTVTTTGGPAPTVTEAGVLPTGVSFVGNSNGTATLSGTPASGSGGTYPLSFTASNGVGTPASQAFTLTVDQPPVITSVNNTTFAVGVAGTFTVSTSGTPAPNLSETGALPSGVNFTDNGDGKGQGFGTLSGTPAAGTAGTYIFTINAGNGVGSAATQTFTLTVTSGSGGTAPTITSANNTTFEVGTVELFLVTTTGSPSPALTATGTLPSGVTFADNGNGTGALGGTPAAGTGGTYSFTFTANNGVGTPASQAFTLTVDSGPAITSANNTTFAIGATQTFAVTTTGTPTASVSESGALPTGVTFADNGNGTGALSGTPAAGTGGTYSLVFTASNGIGTAASQSFTLTVAALGTLGPLIYDYNPPLGTATNCSPTCSVNTPASTKTGDLLIVQYAANNAPAGTKIASVGGDGTWHANGACLSQTSGVGGDDLAYNLSASSNGATSLSITLSANDPGASIEIYRYEGSGTYALDGSCQTLSNQSTTTNPLTASITTSAAADLVFSAVTTDNIPAPGVVTALHGNGWTPNIFVGGLKSGSTIAEDARSVAPATYQAQFVASPTGTYNSSTLAFAGMTQVSGGCTDETLVNFSGGSNGGNITAPTMASSTHGLAIIPGTWSLNGTVTPTFEAASAIGPLNAVTLCGGGASFSASSSTLGMSLTGTGVAYQAGVSYTWIPGSAFGGYASLYAGMWYSDNLSATDASDIDCLAITGHNTSFGTGDYALVNCYGNGTTRFFQLETAQGNGSAINVTAGSTCPCFFLLNYQAGNGTSGGTHSLAVYDHTGTLIGTSSHTGAAKTYYASYMSIGQQKTAAITSGKVAEWGTIFISGNGTTTK